MRQSYARPPQKEANSAYPHTSPEGTCPLEGITTSSAQIQAGKQNAKFA